MHTGIFLYEESEYVIKNANFERSISSPVRFLQGITLNTFHKFIFITEKIGIKSFETQKNVVIV